MPAVVAEHPVGNERGKIRVAGADVEIQPAVVVEVAKVGAHRVEQFEHARLLGDVGKGAVAVVVIQPGALTGMRQTEVVGGDVAYVLDTIATHEDVGPAVVVVVPKPAGETS